MKNRRNRTNNRTARTIRESHDDIDARIKKVLSEAIIEHTILRKAVKAVGRAIRDNANYSEPRHLIIVGESGCGKTTVCDTIAAQHVTFDAEFKLGVQRKVGALMMSIPSPVTPRSMAAELLRELGITRALHGNTRELTEELLILLKQCDVEVVILDEFQHLLSVGSSMPAGSSCKKLREVQDWVKSLIVKSGITFVLLGLPETTALVWSEPQLRRRFNQIYRLRPFPQPTQKDPGELPLFADDLLGLALQKLTCFDDVVEFSGQLDHAERLYFATGGNPSHVKQLIIDAARRAFRRGSRAITLGDFACAYDTFSGLNDARLDTNAAGDASGLVFPDCNPFSAPLDVVRTWWYRGAA